MTPEQEQMLSRLEMITLKPRSKMWLKSDDDAQIEEDLPTLLSLVREQARALERGQKEYYCRRCEWNGAISAVPNVDVEACPYCGGDDIKEQRP